MSDGERLLEAFRSEMERRGMPEVPEVVRVTAAGGKYLLRSLTAERWAAINRWSAKNRDGSYAYICGLYSRLIVASVVDARGNPLFTESDKAGIETWPPMTLEAIASAIVRHNRLRDERT